MKTTTQPPAAGEAAHTPTPWHVATDGITVLCGDRNDPEIICRMELDDIMAAPCDESEANAAFIVRACNSHAALVGALKRIQTKAECASVANPRVVHECFDEIEEIARAALQAAKE